MQLKACALLLASAFYQVRHPDTDSYRLRRGSLKHFVPGLKPLDSVPEYRD
jgi:hypothetical protein